jgi:hypothetical protein
MLRALEQSACGGLIETKAQLQRRKGIVRCAFFIDPAHLRRPAHRDAALPRHSLRVGRRFDQQGAYRAVLDQCRELAVVPGVVGALVVRKLRRCAGEDHCDAAFQINVRKIVVTELRSFDPVAGEHQRRADRRTR